MSLMDQYTHAEKQAVIAFLYMIITADLEVQIDELNLVWMLARSIHIDLKEIENMNEDEFKHILFDFTDDQMIEVLRMCLTLLSVDQNHQEKEKNIIRSMFRYRQKDELNYQVYYETMNTLSELTALDQVVLLVLAHYMAEADGVISKDEKDMLVVLCNMVGVNIDDVPHFKIPKEALYHAVFSMSPPAVKRLVEELIIISIADFNMNQQEYDFILPILQFFNFNFHEMLNNAKQRLHEHIEYYELFHIQSEVH
ncbi:MAG: hypothetical protein WC992_08755 [Acholeplasmataceae bacterium]|nr:hypothetical protein [Acholeplasmataceae bacterium]